MIKIQMFQAGYGDSLLVQIEEKDKEPVNIMIDCGFLYKTNILPSLKRLLKNQVLNRFIITHYDKDHIQSAANFLEDNGSFGDENIVKIEQVWLNTYRHLQFEKSKTQELRNEEKAKLENYISKMSSSSQLEDNEGNIGAKQASVLGKTILEKEYPWNTDVDGKAICTENLSDTDISDNVKLHLLTPNVENLKNLEEEFISKLTEMGLAPKTENVFDDAFELFSLRKEKDYPNEGDVSAYKKVINSKTIKTFSKGRAYERDTSIGNGSSISFILEIKNKKLLFLADAFAEDVIEVLRLKFPNSKKEPIFFDAIKVAHHGSFRNNSPELFKTVDSDKFLFSTNGKHQSHKHPDVETVSCIVNRGLPKGISKRNLIFNYELEHLKEFKREELKSEFHYEMKIQVETEI